MSSYASLVVLVLFVTFSQGYEVDTMLHKVKTMLYEVDTTTHLVLTSHSYHYIQSPEDSTSVSFNATSRGKFSAYLYPGYDTGVQKNLSLFTTCLDVHRCVLSSFPLSKGEYTIYIENNDDAIIEVFYNYTFEQERGENDTEDASTRGLLIVLISIPPIIIGVILMSLVLTHYMRKQRDGIINVMRAEREEERRMMLLATGVSLPVFIDNFGEDGYASGEEVRLEVDLELGIEVETSIVEQCGTRDLDDRINI
jgi:hypothetical protein